MYLYEPHGYDHINGDVKSFLHTISTRYNLDNEKRPLELVRYDDFSLNKEIQYFIPEIKENKRGYCVNYSYFWLYLILHCSKCLPDIPIEHIVKNIKLFYKVIEKSVGKEGSVSKSMSNIVHAFVNNIVSEFMDKVARLKYPEQEKINGKINKYILDNMPKSRYYSRRKIDPYLEDLYLEDLYPSDEERDFHFSRKSARKPRKSARKPKKSPRKSARKPKKSPRKSARKLIKSPRKPRKSPRKSRKSPKKPRKPTRKLRKSLRKSRKSPRKSLRKSRKSLRKSPRNPRKSPRKSRKSPRKSRKSLRKSRKSSRKPRKSPRKSRK
jgi:hypothetical protein